MLVKETASINHNSTIKALNGEAMKTVPEYETQEHYRDEYKEASANLRHYSLLRFSVFTHFLAVQAGLISFGLNANSTRLPTLAIVIKIVALVATFVFWIYSERVNAYRKLFIKRACDLESRLGFEQYVSKPMLEFLSTLFATRLFFLAVAAFWLSTFLLK